MYGNGGLQTDRQVLVPLSNPAVVVRDGDLSNLAILSILCMSRMANSHGRLLQSMDAIPNLEVYFEDEIDSVQVLDTRVLDEPLVEGNASVRVSGGEVKRTGEFSCA